MAGGILGVMFERCARGASVVVAAVCLLAPARASADVSVTLANGHATIVARNATLRQVLAEWARVGGTRVVNLERVGGAPDSYELRNIPEAKALATILRSVAGYIAAPRPATSNGASIYDRILILPTSVASPAPAGPVRAGPTPAAPVYEPPPDPTGLANDDSGETPAPVFQANGQEGAAPAGPAGTPPPPMTTPGVTPYTPAPADPGAALAGQPTAPPQTPTAGQFAAPQPGVLPTPSPTQPQPQPKP
jgi:hypothetical protein